MNTADNTTDEGVDVVDMLIQLLVRQVSARRGGCPRTGQVLRRR